MNLGSMVVTDATPMLGVDAGKRGREWEGCGGRSALFCSSSLKPGTALKHKTHEEVGGDRNILFQGWTHFADHSKANVIHDNSFTTKRHGPWGAAAEWHWSLCRHWHTFQQPREADTAVLRDSVASSVNSATGASGCCSPQPRWTLPWAPPHQGVGLLSLRAGQPGRRCPLPPSWRLDEGAKRVTRE